MLPLFDNIPTRRLPVVTYVLVAANFAVWLWELSARAGRIDRYAFYPCAVSGPCVGAARDHLPWPEGTVTSMFMHASWLHILGNMLFLVIFGNNVEDVMGRIRFLVFYVAGGFAAALTQTWVTLHWAGGFSLTLRPHSFNTGFYTVLMLSLGVAPYVEEMYRCWKHTS